MIPLFLCESCGFLSTRIDAYTTRKRVRFCTSCAEAFDDSREPVVTWVRNAIERAEERS